MGFKKMVLLTFTGKDNKTVDIARVLWFEAAQVYMALTFYAIYKGSYTFDPLLWGSGLAALAGGFGASLYAKAGTEPSEAMMVKTDKVTFKQATGRPMLSSDDGDSSDASDTPPADAPEGNDDSDAPSSQTTATTASTTTVKAPVGK